MEITCTTKIANSYDKLDKLLSRIESGKKPKPDWINLQSKCRLDKLQPEARRTTLQRLHRCVLRGFRANNVEIRSRQKRLDYWRSVASSGFHDFSDQGWMKCYDSPFVEDYDYIGPFLKGGLDALDPYALYSSVLGTFDFTVEDFVATQLCKDVRTIVEPMAGTAEFCYHGHFRYPDFRYVMIDLDAEARDRVMAQPWIETTEKHYIISDVLDEEVWKQIKTVSTGESLAYIGKQSHHLFDAKQLFTLMATATGYVDYLMFESPQLVSVVDMGGTDEMTREEMEDAGFEVELVEDEDGDPNPFTNLMHFHLAARTKNKSRKLFSYRDWTVWSQPILVTLARLLNLNALYYHSELHEFISVDEDWDTSDVLENVTFMMFTRRETETIEIDRSALEE